MSNPNDIYKRAVLDLQARLGRPPTTRDPEYVKLGEELRLAWGRMGRAEETVLPPTKPRTSEEQRAMYERQRNPLMDALRATANHLRDQSSADDAYARAHAALGGPGTADNEPMGESAPEEGSGPDSASQPVMVGGRGPSGGMYAVCSSCQRVWERPKQRGRPAYKCEECR